MRPIGIALGGEVLAADALRDGRLARLSPLWLPDESAFDYWLVQPPELSAWPPMPAFRAWLHAEMERSLQGLGRLA